MPGGFAPPAHDVFADAVELLVAGYQVKDPAGKDVDVGVAVGGQQANAAVLAYKALPDYKAFFLFDGVAESIGCGGIDELGDACS